MAKVICSLEVQSDRYKYDQLCRSADGWAQMDTRQDASYYGNWVNPLTFQLISYCEGDVTNTECEDEADFVKTLQGCIAWHRERNLFIGIDCMPTEPARAAFERMGFAAELP